MHSRFSFLLAFLFGALLAGCGDAGNADGVETEAVGHAQYIYPDHAKRFRWRTADGGLTCLEILAEDAGIMATVYRDSGDMMSDPLRSDEAVVLGERGKGLATMSSTHVALMEPWDPQLDAWSGGGYLKYIRSTAAQAHIQSGRVLDFGGNPEWNHEAILASDFRAFCTYPFGNPLEGVEWAQAFPVVPVVEYEEPSPLGRAEWMRALAWMMGDVEADSAHRCFSAIAQRYQSIQQAAAHVCDPLVVLTGSVEQGAWTAPNGNSFVARLIEDAGGQYAFAEEGGRGNVELSLEALYAMRAEVDALGLVLYDPDTTGFSLTSWKEGSPHHAQIVPHSQVVFAANTMTCDYFGWWVAHPDVLLANLRDVLYGDAPADALDGRFCFERLRP